MNLIYTLTNSACDLIKKKKTTCNKSLTRAKERKSPKSFRFFTFFNRLANSFRKGNNNPESQVSTIASTKPPQIKPNLKLQVEPSPI